MAVCNPLLTYSVQVDWNNDGDYSDTSETVSGDILQVPVTFSYGRDQQRSLSPAGPGALAYSLCNSDYSYSPGGASPIATNVLPGRPTRVLMTPTGGAAVTGFVGRIDDLNIHSERNARNVEITGIDAMEWISTVVITTVLFEGIRTGDAITEILNQAGWPAAQRSIDAGATVMPFWCVDGLSAGEAIADLVKSEGPGAIAFVQGGVFVFQDRHARTLDANSITSQNTYCVADSLGCVAPSPCPGGSLVYTDPFVYDHGLRNIINKVQFSIDRLKPRDETAVWTTESTFSQGPGGVMQVIAESENFFREAVVPVDGVDFQTLQGSATATLSRTSGKSTLITLTAGAAPTTISGLQLRAKPVYPVNTSQVTASDATSIAKYGEQAYQETVPWANTLDAQAIANLIVAARKDRVPIVQIRTVNKDATHQTAILNRKVSDLITVRNDRLGVNTAFYVERIEHSIHGVGQIHAQVLGCEQQMVVPPTDLFIFGGTSGHRFNEGKFGA